jgi:hypothetical protein
MSWFKKYFCKKEIGEIEALKIKLEASKVAIKSAMDWRESKIMYEEPRKLDLRYNVSKLLAGAKILFIADYNMYGIDKKDVEKVMSIHPEIADSKYIKEAYDCDDFASAMFGVFNQRGLGRFAFGYALSKSHAFNIFVDRECKLWVVEPQTNRIMSYDYALTVSDIYKINRYFF